MTQEELFNHIIRCDLKEGQIIKLYLKNSNESIEVYITYQEFSHNKKSLYFLSNDPRLNGYSCVNKKEYRYSYVIQDSEDVDDLYHLNINLIVPSYTKNTYSLTF